MTGRTSFVPFALLTVAAGLQTARLPADEPTKAETVLHGPVRADVGRVNTIHEVGEITRLDGTTVKAGETWYVRGRGFSCRTITSTRIDDGRHYWEHMAEARFASRAGSIGRPEADALLDQALDSKAALERYCMRFAGGDREIDKRPCRCYRIMTPSPKVGVDAANQPPDRETLLYVSEDLLVRRLETRQIHDRNWLLVLVRTWEYDVAVPDNAFEPAFGADVEVVDLDETFGRLVDLRTALHVTESSGLIFAVHRAEAFEDGGVLLMTSVRGTEETLRTSPLRRRALPSGLPRMVSWTGLPVARGMYAVDGPAKWDASPQGNGWFRIRLASASHEGVEALWWIMLPRGRPAGALEVEPGKVKATYGVFPAGNHANRHKDAKGVVQYLPWEETIAVPRRNPLPSLEAVAESVYAELTEIRALPFRSLDLGVSGRSRKIGTIDDTTSADFATAVAEHFRYWERQDIDFQITKGGSVDPKAKDLTLIPAAHLGHYRIVDDDTLKRFAERPEIRIVSLRGTRITNAGLAHLHALDRLEDLDLAETQVDDAGLEELKKLKSLKRLNLSSTQVTPAGVKNLLGAIAGLQITAEK